MKFILPKPKSTNHIYGFTSRGGFARSYITKEGKEWFNTAALLIASQREDKKTIKSKVRVDIEFYTCRRQDIDGILKPLLDSLEKNGIIENDVLICDLHIKKHKTICSDERVEIIIQVL